MTYILVIHRLKIIYTFKRQQLFIRLALDETSGQKYK